MRLLASLLVFATLSRQRLRQAGGLLERALKRDLELRGFRQSSLKSTRRFALLACVLFLLVHKAFMGFLRHVRLGIQQRALKDVIQGPCVIIDPSCQDSAVWVGEVVHVHAARGTSYSNSRQVGGGARCQMEVKWQPTERALACKTSCADSLLQRIYRQPHVE